MRYVVLCHAPSFEPSGTVHRLEGVRGVHPAEGQHTIVHTVCGIGLGNTEATATLILDERPRTLPLCASCKK